MKIKVFFLHILVLLVFSVSAQLGSLPSNLSNFKSSDISDAQLIQVVQQMKVNNITTEQAYQLLIDRGMSAVEASLIKSRIANAINTSSNNNNTSQTYKSDDTRQNSKLPDNKTIIVQNPKKIYGVEIFNNGVLTYEPNLKITPPDDYIIGPEDEILISIFGYQEAKYNITVSPEGDINIPNVGIINVNGQTILQANQTIKNKLANSGYSSLKSGLTKLKVSIGKVKSIRVTILGEVVKPGSYTLSSLSTVFNALFLSGGPNDIGSMRLIEIIRAGKIIAYLDMYDFLIKGNQKNNIYLKDQDIIRIPAYENRVSVEGEVKRTGLYEIKKGETLQDVIQYVGGFTDSAFTASVQVIKSADIERKIYDITKEKFSQYFPTRSESIIVKKIINRFANKVSINGAVYLPGDYELSTDMKISDLIKKAQGVKEDAFKERALLVRYKNDLTPEMISFNINDVLNNPSNDISLKNKDVVSVSSIFELKENATVLINGEVRKTGKYNYNDKMTLKDLIMLAGGFTEAASSNQIEIARRVKSENENGIKIAEIININTSNELSTKTQDIILQPWDVINVRTQPGFSFQIGVSVNGEVKYPGDYIISNKTERISDLVKRSGGLTNLAYVEAASLMRINKKNSADKKIKEEKLDKIQVSKSDTITNLEKELFREKDPISLDLKEILKNPGSKDDLLLEEGDVLTVPKFKSEIRVSGEVYYSTQIVFEPNQSLKYYINKAGGFTENARKSNAYVLYPNGSAGKSKGFLFFRSYPKVIAGSEIIVPSKSDSKKQKLSTGEVIGISTAIASMGGVLVALLNILKK
jgi:protein involved in polysaccharide export with SLBB domain